MKNGGYKIIDLKDTNLTTSASATLSGIYEAIENNYRKAILLSGIVIDGVKKADAFVTVDVANSNYLISNVYGMNLTITDEDVIISEEAAAVLHSYSIVISGSMIATDNTTLNPFELHFNLTTKNKITTKQDVYDYVSELSYYDKILATGIATYTTSATFKCIIKYIGAPKPYPGSTTTGFNVYYIAVNTTNNTITNVEDGKTITEESFIAATGFNITEL